MKHYNRLVFVSASDTCRSPMAEAMMKDKYLMGPLEILSKGLVVLFSEPVNQKAEAVLVSNGLTMQGHMSVGLESGDFGEDSLILAMEEQHKQKILEEYNNPPNVYTLSEFAGGGQDVIAPIGGALVDYGSCYELLDDYIKKVVVILNEEELL